MDDLLLSEFNPVSELVVACNHKPKPKFKVYDIHTHMGSLLLGTDYAGKYNPVDYRERLENLGIYHCNNLDGVWGDDLDAMLTHIKPIDDFVTTFVWVDTQSIDDICFESNTREHLRQAYNKGARGIKMWKVISLAQKDKSGKYIRMDDDRLRVVYETAAELGLVMLIHIADPTAFFKPITAQNERVEELGVNPDWSFCAPGLYKFHELMEMQDNMIRKNPDTTFIMAHVGSYAENLAHVSARLDEFPNMYVDTAARLAELGRQPYTSRDFFIKYADRILFGSDCYPLGGFHHQMYYRFFETFDEYFPYISEDHAPDQGRWYIYGINLPDDILKKIYHENAERLMGLCR